MGMLNVFTAEQLPAGTLPPQWATMTALQELRLNVNSFSGRLPVEWETMKQMRRFYAPGNMLTGVALCACKLSFLAIPLFLTCRNASHGFYTLVPS